MITISKYIIVVDTTRYVEDMGFYYNYGSTSGYHSDLQTYFEINSVELVKLDEEDLADYEDLKLINVNEYVKTLEFEDDSEDLHVEFEVEVWGLMVDGLLFVVE